MEFKAEKNDDTLNCYVVSMRSKNKQIFSDGKPLFKTASLCGFDKDTNEDSGACFTKGMTNYEFNSKVFLEIKKAIYSDNIPAHKENYLIEKRAPGFDWSYAFLIAAIVGSGVAGAALLSLAFTLCPLVGIVTVPVVTAWSVTAASTVCGVAALGAWGFFLSKAVSHPNKEINTEEEYINPKDYEFKK
jgi:hypothetical protein